MKTKHPTIQRNEITTGQAAKILGISRQAVHQQIATGSLIPAGVSPDGVYVFHRGYVEGKADAKLRVRHSQDDQGEPTA